MIGAYDNQLTQAYELIEQEQHSAAREILENLVARHPDDPDVWWVYSHALEDEAEAKSALDKVAQLDPDYPGLASVSAGQPAPASSGGIKRLGSTSTDDFDDEFELDGLDDDDDLFALDEEKSSDEKEGNPLIRRLIIAGVILALVVIGLFILLSGGGSSDEDAPEGQPTAIADNATDTNNGTQPTVAPTLGAPAQSASNLEAAFADFPVAETNTLITTSTNLGTTQIVSICQTDIAGFAETVSSGLDVFAENIDQLTTDAVAVRVVNCDTDDVINTIGVTQAALQDYVNSGLDAATLRSEWTPVS